MKKILWLTLDFPPQRGGVAVYLKHVCRELGDQFVVVVTPPNKKQKEALFKDEEEPYKIFRKKLLWPAFIWPRWTRAFWHILRLVKKTKPSILCTSHVLPLGYVLRVFLKLKKIPYWINLHGMDLLMAQRSRWKLYWLKKVLRSAEHIIVNSQFTKNALMELEIVDEENITIVYPCPDSVDLLDTKQLDEYRYKYALAGKEVIFSLGRLVRRKGFDRVIHAFANVIKQVPSAVYLIAGAGSEMVNLEKLILDLKLQNNVRILGAISNKERSILYQLADVFIMPTIKRGNDVEGFGIVYLEAAAYGVPVIAANSGGAAEAIVHGSTGLLTKSSTPEELEKALLTLLQDEKFRRTLGGSGKQRVQAEFIWKDQVNKLRPYLQ